MKQTQFREELVVAAVEGILSIKPRNDVELSGWLQVALEASATLRTVPLWQGLCGRRAAADATFRLLARLCATTRACVNARPGATDAEGTHKAAQRVLTALTQEVAAAAEKGDAGRRGRGRGGVDRVETLGLRVSLGLGGRERRDARRSDREGRHRVSRRVTPRRRRQSELG